MRQQWPGKNVLGVGMVAIMIVLGVLAAEIVSSRGAADPSSTGTQSGYHFSGSASGITVSATQTPAILPTATPPAAFVAQVIALTNADRQPFGCPALTPNAILMSTAQSHSIDMAVHDFVGHNSSDGSTAWQRIWDAGYHYEIVAENVAWGQTTPQQAVDAWFNEKPPNDLHRQNILNCALRNIGVGYYYLASGPGTAIAHTFWTEDFGTLP
jgi:uncharacterized protein YkwD